MFGLIIKDLRDVGDIDLLGFFIQSKREIEYISLFFPGFWAIPGFKAQKPGDTKRKRYVK